MPNTPPTAASAGSDLNGMAVYEACQTINSRLAKYKKSNPSGAWEDWVKAAFFDRVSLMRYMEFGTVDIMLLQATIIRHYFVKTQTSVASFGPPDLSIIFSTGMYLEVSPL